MNLIKNRIFCAGLVLIMVLMTACGSPPVARPEISQATPSTAPDLSPTATVSAPSEPPMIPTSATFSLSPTSQPEVTNMTTPSALVQEVITSTLSATPVVTPIISPTPTSIPLSSLDNTLQTIVYTVNGTQGPEIYRVQVDDNGQKAGPVERVDFATHPRIRILALFPAPDGQRVAVGWVFDTGTTHVSILEIATGQLTPLFGQADIDQRATFLDWSPDGQQVLVMGGTVNPDLGNSAWLVDIDTHDYRDVDIKQVNELPRIYDASISPDGESVVYAQKNHSQGGSEIWRIGLNSSNRQLLFEATQGRIDNILWSPSGDRIAFTQWVVDAGTFPSDAYGIGELYILRPDGSEEHKLNSVVTHFDNQLFRPAWSSDGEKIIFVTSKNEGGRLLNDLSSNLHIFNLLNAQTSPLTELENAQIIKPTWSPDGDQVAFLIKGNNVTSQFGSQIVTVDNRTSQELGVNEALIEAQSSRLSTQTSNLDDHSFISWLP